MYQYSLVEQFLSAPDIGSYQTFGIQVWQGNTMVALISDVSPDRALVERLAAQCTNGQLEPVHILDVVHNSI